MGDVVGGTLTCEASMMLIRFSSSDGITPTNVNRVAEASLDE